MMKYNIADVVIPQDRREEINQKILSMISTGKFPNGITAEDVFNSYTGVGGLHGLKKEDFENFHEYTEAKKEIEHGQFFTPHRVCKEIAELIHPKSDEFIADVNCGMGNFFNYFNEKNCYGIEIDKKATSVARYLYPDAEIKEGDFRSYKLPKKIDYVIGNPPFNLKIRIWREGLGYSEDIPSQFFFFEKSAELLKPSGLMIAVVPDTFLQDIFFNKKYVDRVNEWFNYVGQYKLSSTAFAQMGVKSFPTKVMCFQKRSENIEEIKFDGEYCTRQELEEKIELIQKDRGRLKAKLLSELVRSENKAFEYKCRKYLYEIKSHPKINKEHGKAIELLEKFSTQSCPEGMDFAVWNKEHRLTEASVLRSLKLIIQKQSLKQRDVVAVVKDNYKFRLKAYSHKANRTLTKEQREGWKISDMVVGISSIPQDFPEGYKNLVLRKKERYKKQLENFSEMGRDAEIDSYLRRSSFVDADLNRCYFNKIQRHDLGLLLQKSYGILAWQMGGGKSGGAFAWAKYKPMRNTFVVSASLAINLTWSPFLDRNGIKYIQVKTLKDIESIEDGDWILLSFEFLTRYKKQLKELVRVKSQKINLIFDESDEITSSSSKRTRAVLSIFRKAKRKLLTTGTTTRNNISELYSQLELLYNNSYNFMSWSENYYVEETDKDTRQTKLLKKPNKHFKEPFPAYYGQTMFKRCFNPSKTTVFGIKKQDQNLYNESDLRDIIEKTVITRKFREIAGDKYKVETVTCHQNNEEREVYRKIIKEFDSMIPSYFSSTGSSRKDSMLRIIRQISLLIEATSTPHLLSHYRGTEDPNKAKKIFKLIGDHNQKIAIGCTSIKGTEWYAETLEAKFPDREIFMIVGDVSFDKRKDIIRDFEATENGVLVCTQQSLKSSVNIPTCDLVIVESLQWNIPKIEQFYFRFIRYNSLNSTRVIFVNYEGTIETNLMALLMSKERLNDFVKTLEYRENSDIYEEYGVDLGILDSLMTKQKDEDGKMVVQWGKASSN